MFRKNVLFVKIVDFDGAIIWEDYNEVSYGGKLGIVLCYFRCIKFFFY